MNTITINAQHLGTFTTFDTWVNKAASWLGGFPKSEKIVCVDKEGNTCTNGADFMRADKDGLFPVTAYRLVRTTERIPA